MAKRAAPDEKPYRPLLDADLLSAVIAHEEEEVPRTSSPARSSIASTNIVEMPIADSPQRDRYSEREFSRPMAAGRTTEPTVAHIQDYAVKVDSEKRILFTKQEVQALDRMVASLAMRLECQVKVSHVIRSLVALLLHAESHVDRRAGESAPLVRPPNGDAQAIQAFEREIATIISAALRDAGPIR
jgi:hypothetical protein